LNKLSCSKAICLKKPFEPSFAVNRFEFKTLALILQFAKLALQLAALKLQLIALDF
jgi:hypothetical protein